MNTYLIFWAQSFVASSALILFALIVARSFRRSASIAHFVLILTLLLIPVCLVACALLQPYQFSVVSFRGPAQDPFRVTETVDSGFEKLSNQPPTRKLSKSVESFAEGQLVKSEFLDRDSGSIRNKTSDQERSGSPTVASVIPTRINSSTTLSAIQIVSGIWLFGVLLGLIRLMVGGRTICRIAARATWQSTESLGSDVQKLLVKHRIGLFASEQITAPFAIGVGRRAVILPTGFLNQFDINSVDRVLVHEAAHIIRRDQYWLLIQRLFGVIFWPHVLVHVLNRAIDETREDVCDNLVLKQYRAVDYSRDLLQMSQTLAFDGSGLLAPGLFTRRNLASRISGLLTHQRRVSFSVGRVQAFGIALVLTVACGGLAVLGVGIQEPSLQRYLSQGATGVFEPMFRSVEMTATCPSDLKLLIGDEAQVRTGQIRYGSDGSTRVGFAIRFDEQGDFELYLDRNRDRTINEQELIEGVGPTRTCELNAEIAVPSQDKRSVDEFSVRKIKRSVVFRKSYSWDRIGFATVGFVEGIVELTAGEQTRKAVVRRVDATGNGLVNDSADRIWIDVDGNSNWDPVTELFSPKPFIEVAGTRYAVKTNEEGTHFQLVPNSQSGSVTLVPSVSDGAMVTGVKVLLTGKDHSAITLNGLEPIEVPTGTYRIENVEIIVQDPKTELNSSFVFSSSGRLQSRETDRDFEVTNGNQTEIDPIGKLLFQLYCENQFQPGKELRVSPRLFTQDGLNLSSSFIAVGPSVESNRESSVQTRVTNSNGETIFGHESFFW